MLVLYFIALIVAFYIAFKIFRRLQLSFAKHPSLRGHSKWSRRISRYVQFFEYGEEEFFASDGAPVEIVKQRQRGMARLKKNIQKKFPTTTAFSQSLEDSISDVRFTNAYKVPFPYRTHLAKELTSTSIVEESQGVKIKDLDGNWSYDLFGSYGVNVFGYDFYKDCMEKGFSKVKNLGPVLGPYHPLIRDNVEKLKNISGLDEVSFHMSGTEAVMQAVRLARYHTGRSHLVRFCGAYHGWWDGVQPGIGNQRKVNDVYTLEDLSENTLNVLATRKDIACVLINPLQALSPNADTSSDATLISSMRHAHFDREKYTKWLKRVRDVCTKNNIVLIFDEVFMGFRLGYRGAQEYFDVKADMVTYGKTLGGGLPVGVVCGRHNLMKRFKDDQPANISFARGTFNSHPYVLAAMNEFLRRIEQPEIQNIFRQSEKVWNARAVELNEKLQQADLPLRVENMQSVWTILYTKPGRYNWMLQFYCQSNGLALSWIGSGRLIFSLNYTDDDFKTVTECFIQAAEEMKADGWWWQHETLTNKSIKRMMLKDMLVTRFSLLKLVIKNRKFKTDQHSVEEVYEQ